MEIEFDPAKRDETFARRRLDFEEATEAFDGPTPTIQDDRRGYGELRYSTFAVLRGRLVNIVWTPRGTARRVISMRYANDRERRRHGSRLG